ncbi:MAG: hypothetical protein AB1793_09365 [Candidatus Thermoplasmatota archaeon]
MGLLLILLPLGVLGLALALDSVDSPPSAPDPPPPPANTPLGNVLMRARLDAPALAASGVIGAQDVQDLVAAVESEISEASTALAAADAAYEEDYFSYSQLVRKVRGGQASPEELASCQAAKLAADAQAATRDGLLDRYFEAGLATVTTDQVAILRRIRANRVWGLAVHYLVEDRTQEGWVELSDALATRRIHEQYDEDFPVAVQDYLASVDGDADIATAKGNVDTYLATVQTAWNAAVSD